METAVQVFKKIRPIVKKLLAENPTYRDSDEALLARYYVDQFEAAGNSIKNDRAYKFADMLRTGQFISADNIIRARRKVQEAHPELRGENWNARHGVSEDFKKQINQPE